MKTRQQWLTAMIGSLATLMPSALVAQESRSPQVPNQARERTLAAVTSEGDSLTEEQESIAADLQRRLPVMGGFDFSPVIVIVLLQALRILLIGEWPLLATLIV